MSSPPTMRVQVPEGVTLRDPAGTRFPQGEATVPRSSFWLRRITDGSVTEIVPEPEKVKPTTKRKTKPSEAE